MFGLDLAAQTSGIILAGLTACSSATPAVVSVEFAYTPPVYNQSQTMAQLTDMVKKEGHVYGVTELGQAGGLTKSDFTMSYGVSLGGMADSQTGNFCIWVDEVNIKLSYAPIVSIAADFAQGSCWYFRTMAHELKHVEATLKTAEEYKPYLRKVAEGIALRVEPAYPVPPKDIEAAKQYLADRFKAPLARAGEKMMASETLRQRAVDDYELNKTLTTDCAMAPVR